MGDFHAGFQIRVVLKINHKFCSALTTPEHEIFAHRSLSFAPRSRNLTSVLLLFLPGTADRDAAGVLPVPVYYR